MNADKRARSPAADQGRHPAGGRGFTDRARRRSASRGAAGCSAATIRLARHRHAVHLRTVQRQAPEDTPSRQRDLHLPSGGGAGRRAVRAADLHHAGQARLPPAGDRCRHHAAVAIYKEGRAERDFDAGVERALEALLSSPKFLLRIEREPAGAARGVSYRLSDLELASRLSFFLWRSMPDDELIDLAARNQLKDGGPGSAGPAPARRPPRHAVHEGLLGAVAEVRNIHGLDPNAQAFDDSLRKAMARETELFFESQVRDGPTAARAAARRLHVPERAARAALRDHQHLRQPLPARAR